MSKWPSWSIHTSVTQGLRLFDVREHEKENLNLRRAAGRTAFPAKNIREPNPTPRQRKQIQHE